jgi:hypothetical protein
LKLLTTTLLFIPLLAVMTTPVGADSEHLSGKQIMEEVYKRHEQFPYIYEEQVMVLIDAAGNRDTRKLRRYSRLDSADNGRYLLLFDDPPEVRGVGLLTTIQHPDSIQAGIYLPALGDKLIESIGQNESESFLGTDFSVYDLLPEPLEKYHFKRQSDKTIDEVNYFIIDIYKQKNAQRGDAPPYKRHYIRQDNYYITRTDTFDRHGRIYKQQTHHDLKPLGGHMWRANMMLMENMKTRHQTLIKIERRVFSRDYVPESLFTLQWLIDNQHMSREEETIGNDKDTAADTDAGSLTLGQL